MAKVSEQRDLLALGAKYHNQCLTQYKNKHQAELNKHSYNNMKKQALGTTFAKIIAHINKTRDECDPSATFDLSDLAELQKKFMQELGYDYSVQKTSLKQKLLEECPYLIAIDKKGSKSVIAFKENFDLSLRSTDSQDEEIILKQAARIVRSDLFDSGRAKKDGVPASILDLVTMIVFGTNSLSVDDRACVFMAELLVYHAIEFKKRGKQRRHDINSETSAPVYLACKIYAETRKKTLINCTFNLGMSISYGRLQSILKEKANFVCKMYHKEGVVCPPKMRKGIFTTAAVDNIDHNPSSTTAKTSFHGTAITLMQHKLPDEVGKY